MLFMKGIKIKKKFECCVRALSKTSWNPVTKLKEKTKSTRSKVKGLDFQVPQRIECKSMQVQLFIKLLGTRKNMKSNFLAFLFHVVWNKDNMHHYWHSPTGSDSWYKYNADWQRANNTQTYLGQVFQKIFL